MSWEVILDFAEGDHNATTTFWVPVKWLLVLALLPGYPQFTEITEGKPGSTWNPWILRTTVPIHSIFLGFYFYSNQSLFSTWRLGAYLEFSSKWPVKPLFSLISLLGLSAHQSSSSLASQCQAWVPQRLCAPSLLCVYPDGWRGHFLPFSESGLYLTAHFTYI